MCAWSTQVEIKYQRWRAFDTRLSILPAASIAYLLYVESSHQAQVPKKPCSTLNCADMFDDNLALGRISCVSDLRAC